VAKFPEFDTYQLGKYNKEKSKVPEAKKDPSVVSDEEPEKTRADFRCTIKYLIRVLHISEPVEHTMAILGKKYPETREEFLRSRLPGEFKEEKAGKRMKLPVPETWETEVSAKGNKASTWESLINHRKLPFMAMLRNLRNLISAGISEKHHNNILKKVSKKSKNQIIKNFPIYPSQPPFFDDDYYQSIAHNRRQRYHFTSVSIPIFICL